jgi:hypothetical protein
MDPNFFSAVYSLSCPFVECFASDINPVNHIDLGELHDIADSGSGENTEAVG